MKIQDKSSFGKYSYEPIIVVGTHNITKEQKINLAFDGYVLGDIQNKLPVLELLSGQESRHKN